MWIVISGNPKDGFEYTGTFKTADDANAWADLHVATEYDWWVTRLLEPVWAA